MSDKENPPNQNRREISVYGQRVSYSIKKLEERNYVATQEKYIDVPFSVEEQKRELVSELAQGMGTTEEELRATLERALRLSEKMKDMMIFVTSAQATGSTEAEAAANLEQIMIDEITKWRKGLAATGAARGGMSIHGWYKE